MSFPFKAVLFDWAYTLVNLVNEDDRPAFRSMYEYLRKKNIAVPDFEEMYSTGWELFRAMIENSRETHREACFEFVLNYILNRFSVDLGDHITEQELLEVYYRTLHSCRRVYPDTIPALETLKHLGVPMAVISNTTNPAFIKDKERIQMGLDPYFEFAIYSSAFPYRKPHPSIFHLALGRLGVDPADALYVGDNFRTDVEGSQGAGMKSAWINRRKAPLPENVVPDYQIEALTEIPELGSVEVQS